MVSLRPVLFLCAGAHAHVARTHEGDFTGCESPRVQRLLGDLDENTDTAHGKLKTETRRAQHVSKQGAVCWLYVVICLLFLGMIGIILGKFA